MNQEGSSNAAAAARFARGGTYYFGCFRHLDSIPWKALLALEMWKLLGRQQMLAEFEASLDLAEEVRTRLLARGDHRNPWFVRMSLPLLKCDKLRQFLNTVKDMPDAAAFRMAAEHHDVSHGFIRNAISNMKIRLDSSHQPMENPIPMQVCLPFPDKDAFWPFGSLRQNL